MNIVAIIQARTGSTRFPNKVFCELEGRPLIWHVFKRLIRSKYINNFILATTTNSKDDALVSWAIEQGINYFRGSEEDVLSRYYNASLRESADIIVRITADDPFKDYTVIDNVIELLIEGKLDFAYNNNPPSFPEGLDVEVFTMNALERAFIHASSDFEKEHVTQFFYRNKDDFKQANYCNEIDLSYLRWTIDTEIDYKMASIIYKELYKEGKIFLMNDILSFLKNKPSIAMINSNVQRSNMYKNKI